MNTIKSVEEVAREFNNKIAFQLKPSNDTMEAVRTVKKELEATLTTDRTTILTALCEGLEVLKRTDEYQMSHDHAYDEAIDDAITLVRSTLSQNSNQK